MNSQSVSILVVFMIGAVLLSMVSSCSKKTPRNPNIVQAELVFYNRSGEDVKDVQFTGTHQYIHNLGFGTVIDNAHKRNSALLLEFPFPATIHWTTANGKQHQKSFNLNRVSPKSDLEIVEFLLDENGQLKIHQRAEYP
ncbi:MAG: hypothetical protein MI741_05685 [Rhodospirillales bacterium]|nr:hypothetical protein [Rhodospirillales bacterium]